MEQYLVETRIIDWSHPAIRELAATLAEGRASSADVARNCFEWVRDNINHSYDYKLNPVTCKASDVLLHGTGYCYAKSHLLGALLRANGIPAGFCYQRLSREGEGAPYCLHGLNAGYLPEHGWYRMDARGNKKGVHAQFTPPTEQLAFQLNSRLEADLPEIWPAPLDCVVSVLEKCQTYMEVYQNLPDVDLISATPAYFT